MPDAFASTRHIPMGGFRVPTGGFRVAPPQASDLLSRALHAAYDGSRTVPRDMLGLLAQLDRADQPRG